MAEEITKVETLPEPCEELKNKVYSASKKTNDNLPKGKYKCCCCNIAPRTKIIDKPEELRKYIFDKGDFKFIRIGGTDEEPEEEEIKFLVIQGKEYFIKHDDETCYVKDDEGNFVVPVEDEIKGLNIKIQYKPYNYFWSPIVDDEGE